MIRDTSYTDISFESFKGINREFDFAYISGGIITERKPQGEVLKIVKYLFGRGTKIFFDPQFRIGKGLEGFLDTCTKILNYAQIIFGNESEMNEFPGDLIQKGINEDKIFVYKRGKNGAKVLSRSINFEVNGIEVKAKDTTGAGDIFNAAFLKVYLKNGEIKESLDFANIIAAFSTIRLGFFVSSKI
jgi:sugar/nucleoside kinase (ribokinase family)